MLKDFEPRLEEAALTVGQRLIQQGWREGWREGWLEGRQEGRIHVLLKLLTLRFGQLSPEITARIQASDEQALERLSERFITATTLSGVFDDL